LARPGQTQIRERNHANVTFYFFLIHESVARDLTRCMIDRFQLDSGHIIKRGSHCLFTQQDR